MTASKNQPKGQNNGKKGDTLDRLRYAVYMNLIVSGKTRPYLECFPPTERAAGFHIITAHLQIVQWKSIMLVCLHSEDYSWRKYTTGVYSVICLSVGGNDLRCASQTPAHVVSRRTPERLRDEKMKAVSSWSTEVQYSCTMSFVL